MPYLTSDLVASVKRRANVPTSQITFSLPDFYALADEEIRSKLMPLVLKNMQEFYVRTYDYPLTSNQARYLIPTRAIASGLRDVQIVNSANDESRTPLERLSPEDLYTSISSSSFRVTIQKNGFYLEGNTVVVYPKPKTTSNLLRLSYYCRPNQLVDVSACGLITAINTATNQITLVAIPTTFSISTPMDFVKANPGFECSAIDQFPTALAGNVLTFASLPVDVSVGDYVCLAGQTCVVQVPVELQPLLFQYVVVRLLESNGDSTGLREAMSELAKLEENAQLLIAPRVAGKMKRAVNSRPINRLV